MSYQNQHSLSQPYWNLLFFPLFFPSRNLSHCCFCFHSTVLQQYIWKRLWKGKKKQITHEIFLFPRTYNSQSTNKKSSFFIWKFLSFPMKGQKVFWDTTWLCRKWFCPLSTVILRFVFQKQHCVVKRKIVLTVWCKLILSKESLVKRIKHFLPPSKRFACSKPKTVSFSEPIKTSCPREMHFPAWNVVW